jgi:hypothetical protein
MQKAQQSTVCTQLSSGATTSHCCCEIKKMMARWMRSYTTQMAAEALEKFRP